MVLIGLFVVFVVVMLLWFLCLVGGTAVPPAALAWLPWIAAAVLGVVVFLLGTGVIAVQTAVR